MKVWIICLILWDTGTIITTSNPHYATLTSCLTARSTMDIRHGMLVCSPVMLPAG